MILIKILLYPLALLYAIVIHIRNKLFDWKILESAKYKIPVIAVGNLSYGGTGKTPMIEYLVRLLKNNYHICIISRGYRRKSRGFILVGENHNAMDVGDEPLQYNRKFPDIAIAVDESRKHGISEILSQKPETDLILLDDAFQHRNVKPQISILLTDFHKLYVDDYPLPTGTLREFRTGAARADIIVITKMPKVFSPILKREISKKISAKPHQKIFYSYLEYLDPVPLKATRTEKPASSKYRYILLFSGIANSYPLQDHLRKYCDELVVKDYPDHHKYTGKDIRSIINTFNNILSKDKVIFTTEKDAMRLEQADFEDLLKGLPVYYLPIRVCFHHCDDIRFDKFILSHVSKHQRGS